MEEISNRWVRAVRNEGPAAGRSAVDCAADFLTRKAVEPVHRIHRAMEGYRPTPLVRLDGLAEALGVKAVFVKDESKRFGLNAFKGLGAIYAFTRVVCGELGLDPETTTFADLQSEPVRGRLSGMVFVTATDGNHGKGVAWAAGQLGINAELYEASSLDGANTWQRFRYITWPQLQPTTFFVTIILTINCFKVYDIVYMLAGGNTGVLNESAIVLVYHIYEEAFRNWNLGYASAVSMVLFLIVLAITLVQFRGEKKYAN